MRQPHESRESQLDALWRTHAPAVLRYARRRMLPAEVDEVVAETFVVAWRRLDDVPEVALPWLLGVARGVSANVRRTARRLDALTDRLAAQPAQDDEVEPTLSERVEAALDGLRPDDRELLLLLAWDGLTREQAAQALGVTRGTLAVRLHRVRRRMQGLLATTSAEDPYRSPTPLPQTGRT